MDCSPPGSSVHGILQARILKWVAMLSSRGSSQPRDRTWVSCNSWIAGRLFTAEPPGKTEWCLPFSYWASHSTYMGNRVFWHPFCCPSRSINSRTSPSAVGLQVVCKSLLHFWYRLILYMLSPTHTESLIILWWTASDVKGLLATFTYYPMIWVGGKGALPSF